MKDQLFQNMKRIIQDEFKAYMSSDSNILTPEEALEYAIDTAFWQVTYLETSPSKKQK